MKKKFLTLLGGALLGLFSMSATAQTDVTSTLVNPSFETGNVGAITSLDGWTLPSLGASYSNISLGSNSACNGQAYGIPAASDGSKYFYNRQGWGAQASSLSQAVILPAGKYYISVDYKGIQKGGTTSKLGFSIDGTSILSTTPFYAADEKSGSYATNDPWKTLGAWFTVDAEKSVTIAITETLEGGSARADLYLDNVKLYKWDLEDATNYDNASSTSPMDVTAKFVTNPYFDTNKDGWTSTTGYQNNARATNQGGAISGGFWENWNGSAKTSGKMYQTLSGLTDGIYRLTAAAFADQGTSEVYLYIGDKKEKITAAAPSVYSVQCSVVGGTTEIGLVLGESNAAKWIGLDNVKLEYLGFDATAALEALAETVGAATYSDKHSAKSEEDLQTAIAAANLLITAGTATKDAIATATTNLSSAIAAVEASIADYAALHAAIAAASYAVITPSYTALATAITTAQGIYNNGTAESCADAIAALDAAVKAAKVADYTYVADNFQYGVELGTWTKVGPTGELDDQHWSGEQRPYMEQSSAAWGQNAWSIKYDQDVILPAGDYVFKAAGRKAAGNGCTLQLVVTNKATSALIGTVSDFPEGDTGLGINKAGATSFDPTDAAGFANNGAGRGFQWRFVKFTLTESTTINVAVSAEATTNHQWVSFCDATVQTNNAANIAMIAYNVALNNAKAAIDNDDYKNVTGAEKTALQGLIDADMTGKTGAEIETATSALTAATTAFTEAAPAYDAFASILAKVEDLDADGKASFNTAMAEVLAAYEANTCSASDLTDADAQAAFVAAIKAQGAGSDWTGLIVNPSFEDTTGTLPNGWTTDRNTTGSFDYKLYEETLNTNGTTDGKYVLNAWASQINYIYVKQSVTLPAGVYELSGAVYSDRVNDQHVEAIVNGIKYKSATVSNNNWETLSTEFIVSSESEVTIGIFSNGQNQSGNTDGWFRADNFKLKYVGPVSSANMKIYADVKWGTFVAPFDVTIPEGVEAYKCTEVVDGVITTEFVEGTAIPANTPVLVYSKTDVDETFYGKAVAIEGDPTCGVLVGTYEAKAAPVGSYVLQKNDGVFSFYKVVSGAQPTVGANRCYLSTSSSSTVLRFGGVTGIQSMEQQGESVIYDLTGRRVDAAVKGIYIVGGKKMLVK